MAVLAVVASLAVWTLLAARAARGRPVMPYEPRSRVPWNGLDVLSIFAFYVLCGACLWYFANEWWSLGDIDPPAASGTGQADNSHDVVVLLRANPTPGMFLLCGVMVIVVAPIIEEFLCRLLLVGWLEAVENRWRRKMPLLRRSIPGMVPVTLTSLFFAVLHFRLAEEPEDAGVLARKMAVGLVASLLALAFGVCWLRIRSRATLSDLGFDPHRLPADIRLGLLAFLAIAAPIYLLQWLCSAVLPADAAPDPIPLFFFALALGTLYYRTHRIVPAIVLHMALNATALALLLLMIGTWNP